MSTPIKITPETPPERPCWIYHPTASDATKWWRISGGLPIDWIGSGFTHWLPDQSEAPTVVPQGERVYSDDRLSLAQELAEGLKKRGHWVPKNEAGPDLITAVFRALDSQAEPAHPDEARLREAVEGALDPQHHSDIPCLPGGVTDRILAAVTPLLRPAEQGEARQLITLWESRANHMLDLRDFSQDQKKRERLECCAHEITTCSKELAAILNAPHHP